MQERRDIANTAITYKGQNKLLRNWVKELELNYVTVRMRYTRGVRNPEQLLAPTKTNPKPIDLQHWLEPEQYEKLQAKAKWAQVSPVAMAQHLITQGLKDTD